MSSQEAEVQRRVDIYFESVRAVRKLVPDFDEAYAYLVCEMDERLIETGHPNPGLRAVMIQLLEGWAVGEAVVLGIDPAQELYEQALEWGYVPTEPYRAERIPNVKRADVDRHIDEMCEHADEPYPFSIHAGSA